MFERYTPPAREVVRLAAGEARAIGHRYLGVEHLLLGLLREGDGLAARTLAALAVDYGAARATVAQIVDTGEPDPAQGGQLPLTPRLQRVLELAVAEADDLGHAFVGTEHVLLGLAREDEGVAKHVLLEQGVDAAAVRGAVMRALAGG